MSRGLRDEPDDHGDTHVSGERTPSADSAEVPWAGRDLSPSGFEGDTGEADTALRAALDGAAGDLPLMRAVEAARLLVPIVAEPTEVDASSGPAVETRVDMAAVTLVAPDGRRALPVFTSTDALSRLGPGRPPGAGHRVAGGAGGGVGGLRRHGRGRGRAGDARSSAPRWCGPSPNSVPGSRPHLDPFVEHSVAAALRPEEQVTAHALEEGTPAGHGVLGVVLDLRPGLSAEQVREVATRVGERLATDGELRARIDGLAFRIR